MQPKQIDITKKDVRCCDELLIEDDCINATYELWFDVDKYFGTELNENSWINFYTDWYPDGTIKATYVIDDLPDSYEVYDWELTNKEKEFFIKKMEDYCQECASMSLMELWNKYNEREDN